MRKEEFVEFVKVGSQYIANDFSETEAVNYEKSMLFLFEKQALNGIIDYLALNYFHEYGERSKFYHMSLKFILDSFDVDILAFFKDFNGELNNDLMLNNLSLSYYEVSSGNIVSMKYVLDNITLLRNYLNIYRIHNIFYIDGNPGFIPIRI